MENLEIKRKEAITLNFALLIQPLKIKIIPDTIYRYSFILNLAELKKEKCF